ncbi:histidine kinase [Streptomyces sp. CB00455]|uniref:sensor histidine kinase n=1 Tax=Streptomyces sp. CB00455 TaxID=1703927 RepID=UPI000939A2BA|nr:sensor histidine kinase [Streptomyces sp. CB00455]OKK15655.1 histidine kinase [Streptomyces sp. CB00455]
MTIDWRQYARDHRRLTEAVLIVLLAAASGPATLYSSLPYADDQLGAMPGVPLAFLASLALVFSRRHPRAVVVVTAVCASAAAGTGYLITPLLLAPVMVALYGLAQLAAPRTSHWYCLAVVTLIVATALLANRYHHPWPLTTLNPLFCLLLPVALGSAARLRHAYLEAVQARAEYAERTREEEARHRVAEERVRIARDLHDIVAHHLTVANAQAGTAVYLASTHPDQARSVLEGLTNTTSAALREMKATVGLLRQTGDADSLEPAPGLNQLPDLVDAFRTAGLDVQVTVDGDPSPLTPGTDLTAYRIVQEALTNVTKHATTRTAHVTLAYHPDRLTLTVTNDTDTAQPAPARRSGQGFGLIGMRERAHSAGGRFHAGPRSQGGYTVTAELPVQP